MTTEKLNTFYKKKYRKDNKAHRARFRKIAPTGFLLSIRYQNISKGSSRLWPATTVVLYTQKELNGPFSHWWEASARLDLFKKLGMIWKDRSISASIIRENPRDKPVRNPRDSWSRKSASFRWGIPHSPLSRGRARCYAWKWEASIHSTYRLCWPGKVFWRSEHFLQSNY